ncbi:MAG: hypothetical protein C1O27_000805 [Chloroflexi bacterium]|jgi:hypothetical protein|nr:MAG: hypothetical protein C1O27_000805 [Chloroflexota bacterium]
MQGPLNPSPVVVPKGPDTGGDLKEFFLSDIALIQDHVLAWKASHRLSPQVQHNFQEARQLFASPQSNLQALREDIDQDFQIVDNPSAVGC